MRSKAEICQSVCSNWTARRTHATTVGLPKSFSHRLSLSFSSTTGLAANGFLSRVVTLYVIIHHTWTITSMVSVHGVAIHGVAVGTIVPIIILILFIGGVC